MAQALANGIMAGSIYGLIAVGLALIFGVLHIPQFALAAHAMVAAFVTVVVAEQLEMGYWAAFLVAIFVAWILGYVTQRVVFEPLRDKPGENMFIAAFGLLLVLQSSVQLVFGASYYQVSPPFSSRLTIGPIAYTSHRLLIVTMTLALIGALYWVLQRTSYGLKLRAVADNASGAAVVGLDSRRIGRQAMALGSLLAGVAGVLLAPVAQVYPTMGDLIIIKAFVVIILAGMGSIPGALVGGYILGTTEALGGAYISQDYADAFGFVLLVLVLSVRPAGLFRRRTAAA